MDLLSSLRKMVSVDKRVYAYGAILGITSVGMLYFKASFGRRDEIAMLNQRTTINAMDLITTELPLFVAPYACIDAFMSGTELVYRSIIEKRSLGALYIDDPKQKSLLQQTALCSVLGIGLPVVYVLRNRSIKKGSIQREGIRRGLKRFVTHVARLTIGTVAVASLSRFVLWGSKYSLPAPFAIAGCFALFEFYKEHKQQQRAKKMLVNLCVGALMLVIARKIYTVLAGAEEYVMGHAYATLQLISEAIVNQFIWAHVRGKYLLFGGVVVANFCNYVLDDVMSKYYMPFSYKIKNALLHSDNEWIYDSYYHFVSDQNQTLPRDILREIFSFAGIETEFRNWMENDHVRVQYDVQNGMVQELFIFLHVLFSYASYRELYHRIKAL